MIEIRDLTVRFGGVVPLDRMSVTVGVGTNGLIGPNGAGKTTFFNVMSGFVRPTAGTVTAFGDDLLAMPDFKRVRWGLRRTFQTEQAIANLSVYENVLLVHEHSGSPASTRRNDVVEAVEFVGLGSRLNDFVGTLGAAERRLVEVARAVVGSPKLILLDEPAAGLPDDETAALGQVIKQIPERTGASVILVDHDMDLVSVTCSHVTVLDFGIVIADGDTKDVLNDPNVMQAYLGIEEVVDMSGETLRIDDLDVPRGGRPVLHGVTLDVPAGEITALLGPNGAGKSTLVLTIGGLLRSTSGSVFVGDRDLTKAKPERVRAAGVAVVPEGRRLLPNLSVADNLKVATYSLPRDRAAAGVAGALELFPELTRRLDATARSLSGGEQQMVVLAQAMAAQAAGARRRRAVARPGAGDREADDAGARRVVRHGVACC